MTWLTAVDWHRTFGLQTSLLEMFVRGTVVYLALFALLRIVLRRQSAGVGTTDLLVIVLIADAAQNAMAGSYQSLPDGMALVAVIIGWAWFLDWAAFRFPAVERFIKPPKLPLVIDGKVQPRNMHRELLTMEELRSQLRLQGIDDMEGVRLVFMEPDGRLSVIRADGERHDPPDQPLP